MNQRGFSLLEILIGIAILSIGILAVAGLQITSIRGNSFSDNMMQASILGQDRLEELKALSLLQNPEALRPGTFDDGAITIRGTNFSRVYTVTAHPSPDLPESRVIRVTVGWRDTSDHSVSFSTVKSP
jgi:type IV pilus assembly protein PilV